MSFLTMILQYRATGSFDNLKNLRCVAVVPQGNVPIKCRSASSVVVVPLVGPVPKLELSKDSCAKTTSCLFPVVVADGRHSTWIVLSSGRATVKSRADEAIYVALARVPMLNILELIAPCACVNVVVIGNP
jgi:hypothetical protein